jgi:hypothetical protein
LKELTNLGHAYYTIIAFALYILSASLETQMYNYLFFPMAVSHVDIVPSIDFLRDDSCM